MHSLFGFLLFWRTIVVDMIWLLPRQPLTGGLLVIITPRILTLNMPIWFYTTFGLLFDGDATPVLVMLYVFLLILSGSFNRKSLWTGSNWTKFFTLWIFLLSPTCWLVRIFDAHFNQLIITEWIRADISLELKSVSFSLSDHMLNSFGNPDTLIPWKTKVYKKVKLETLTVCEDSLFPGDSAFPHSREKLYQNGYLELDIYRSRNTESDVLPGIVLHLHGGGWNKGHRQFLQMNYHGGVPNAILSNNFIVSASYRLSCNGIAPEEMLEDVLDAATYVKEHAHEWGADGTKIVPWGTSAGATLALVLAYKYQNTFPEIRGVINFYGVVELREEKLRELAVTNYEAFHTEVFISETRHLCDKNLKNRQSAAEKEFCFRTFSPLAHISSSSPPTLTIHGKQDGIVLVNHAEILATTLSQSNVSHITVTVQGVHDCDVFSSSPCAQVAIHSVNRFLEAAFAIDT